MALTEDQAKFVGDFDQEVVHSQAVCISKDPIFEQHVEVVISGLNSETSEDYSELGSNLRIAIGVVAGQRNMNGGQRRDCVVAAVCRHYNRQDKEFERLVKDLIQALHNERFNSEDRICWNSYVPPEDSARVRAEPMCKADYNQISHAVIMHCRNTVGGVHIGNVFHIMLFTIEKIGAYNISNKEEILRRIMYEKVLVEFNGCSDDFKQCIDANLSVVTVMYCEHNAKPVHRDYAVQTSIVWLLASAANKGCCVTM